MKIKIGNYFSYESLKDDKSWIAPHIQKSSEKSSETLTNSKAFTKVKNIIEVKSLPPFLPRLISSSQQNIASMKGQPNNQPELISELFLSLLKLDMNEKPF